jgi:hypothetical protein
LEVLGLVYGKRESVRIPITQAYEELLTISFRHASSDYGSEKEWTRKVVPPRVGCVQLVSFDGKLGCALQVMVSGSDLSIKRIGQCTRGKGEKEGENRGEAAYP